MSTNVEQKVNLIQSLEQTPTVKLPSLPAVADRFKQIYSVMNGRDAAAAAVKYEAESFHFMKLIQDNKEIQNCTKLSLYGCFLDMAVNGLSFDPAMKHAYVVSFNTNVGTKENAQWEKRAMLMISGYGELQIRTQQGQIKYADNPQLVYEGDKFSTGIRNGIPFVEHEAVYPRQSDNIIACYIRLIRNDGSTDFNVMSIEEVMKLKAFSKQQNSLAWTSGLPGMVKAKTIKHAFRSYPKVKLGQFTKLESQKVEEEEEFTLDYGLDNKQPIVGPADNLSTSTAAPIATNDEDFVTTHKAAPVTKQFEDDAF